MYPFFSGLCGYVFGKNNAGTLDPSDVGVNNKRFLVNATLIDSWNKDGLINAKVDDERAHNAFLKKQAAFWITGPWKHRRRSRSRDEVHDRPDAGEH